MGEVIPIFSKPEKKREMSGADILVKQKELLQGAIEKNQQLALTFGTDSAERRFYDRQNDMLGEEQLRVLFTLSRYQEALEEENLGLLLYQLDIAEKKDIDLTNNVKGKIEQMNDFIRVLEEYRIDDEAGREKKRQQELRDALAIYEQ
jgi:hypothetical protein